MVVAFAEWWRGRRSQPTWSRTTSQIRTRYQWLRPVDFWTFHVRKNHEKNISHDGSMVLYMVCHGSHQQNPPMNVSEYIAAPWMIWVWEWVKSYEIPRFLGRKMNKKPSFWPHSKISMAMQFLFPRVDKTIKPCISWWFIDVHCTPFLWLRSQFWLDISPSIYTSYFLGICKGISPQNMAWKMVRLRTSINWILKISHWYMGLFENGITIKNSTDDSKSWCTDDQEPSAWMEQESPAGLGLG